MGSNPPITKEIHAPHVKITKRKTYSKVKKLEPVKSSQENMFFQQAFVIPGHNDRSFARSPLKKHRALFEKMMMSENG